MKQVILIIDFPDVLNFDTSAAKNNILNIAIKRSKESENLLQLGEYVWSLKLHSELPILGNVVAICNNFHFAYRIAYLENELKWDSFPLT